MMYYEMIDYLIIALVLLGVLLSIYARAYVIIKKFQKALEDGVVTPTEVEEIIKELNIFTLFLKGMNLPKEPEES